MAEFVENIERLSQPLEPVVPVAEQQPRKRKAVALVGFAPSTRHLAPYDDPDVEIWTLNEAHLTIPRFDRLFQMHPRWEWECSLRDSAYADWLRSNTTVPIYMHEVQPDISMSVRYPMERAIEDVGPYLTSSFSYMLRLAILEEFEVIHLYGIDLATDEEYGYQRAGAEFLIGYALAKNIEIIMPDACPLLKSPLYGKYEPERVRSLFTKQLIEARGEALTADFNLTLRAVHTLEGAVQALQQTAQLLEGKPEAEKIKAELAKFQKTLQEKNTLAIETQGALKECSFWIVQWNNEKRANANEADPDEKPKDAAPLEGLAALPVDTDWPAASVQPVASDGSANRQKVEALV